MTKALSGTQLIGPQLNDHLRFNNLSSWLLIITIILASGTGSYNELINAKFLLSHKEDVFENYIVNLWQVFNYPSPHLSHPLIFDAYTNAFISGKKS